MGFSTLLSRPVASVNLVLPRMWKASHKTLSFLMALVFLSACARMGPPLPPSLELPRPAGDLRAVRKGDKVFLSWTSPTENTEGETILHPGPTRVCRSTEAVTAACGTPVGKVAPVVVSAADKKAGKVAKAEYVDPVSSVTGAAASAQFTYAVEVMNSYGRSAGLSNLVRVPAMAAVAPPAGFNAHLTAAGVQISWVCTAPPPRPGTAYQLRIFRRAEGAKAGTLAVTADPFNCQAQVVDGSFEWEKTYEYYAEVVTTISRAGQPEMQIEGDDTPEVQVIAHDVFPPATPAGLQAVFSGAGQAPFIDLSWTSNTEADLAGYNIYRHEEGAEPVKINAELAKAAVYRDGTVQPGRKYWYSVSAVDERGNESGRSEEASEATP